MKSFLLAICCFLFVSIGFSQEDDRRFLRGQVLYRNSFVPDENVINTTAQTATVTNDKGEFMIKVKPGDELVFTAINYQLRIVIISDEILKRGRLVVEVNEKVTQLAEVVVTPEDQERFLEVKNEEFKDFEYEEDRSTEVENIATPQHLRGMRDGINFVNIFKALVKANTSVEEKRPALKISQVMRQVYEDEFFVKDLKLPQDQIDAFLIYCDSKLPAQTLLKKENEFELIDFLVTHSKTFLKQINDEE
ncbi:MAG: carboxypeptidase-like regulatory domain-containing protein [Maribacter sp.]|nr:carboxypeptidase-like regulatory domain-containing protein [Maribacter sp.]